MLNNHTLNVFTFLLLYPFEELSDKNVRKTKKSVRLPGMLGHGSERRNAEEESINRELEKALVADSRARHRSQHPLNRRGTTREQPPLDDDDVSSVTW